MAGRRRQHLCAAGCPELVCAGKEVGMQVGVGGERHRQPALGCGGMHRAQINADIDDQGPSLPQIHQIGRVAQPLIDEGNQIDSNHHASSVRTSHAATHPMFYTIPKMIGECYG